MKRILPLIVTAVVPALALVLVASLAVLTTRASAAAEAKAKIVSVDYVLALMDEGIDQKEIVERIKTKNLAFRVAPGDVDRLRAAGAGEELIEAVTAEGVVLENHETSPSGPATRPQDQGGADASRWARPNRLGNTKGTNPGQEIPRSGAAPAPAAPSYGDEGEESNDEGIVEEPYGGYYAYPQYDYYSPGYYDYMFSYGYGYPYYYYPGYYYPYRSYAYYSGPFCHYPRYSYRTLPRSGGSFRSAPRGGSFRSTPRTGGSARPSPRGSHHH